MAIVALSPGGMVSTLILLFIALPLLQIVLKFGPTEILLLVNFGNIIIVGFSEVSMAKRLLSGDLDILFSTVGTDSMTGSSRCSAKSPKRPEY